MRSRQLLLVILFSGVAIAAPQPQLQQDEQNISLLVEQGVNFYENNSKSNNSQNPPLRCTNSTLGDVRSEDDLLGELLPRVISYEDNDERIRIKEIFVRYLVQSRTFLEMIHCINPKARLLQEDEDGDDGDEGGGGGGGGAGGGAAGAGAAGGVLNNANVLNGVRRVLANVFTGNLIGVIQEGVALRGPAPVTTVFTDVLSTLFGSTATAGITGVLGNITTTVQPVVENVTLSYEEQLYLIQQHQLYLAQQQQQLQQQQAQLGGGQLGGVGGSGGFPNQNQVAGSNQHYPQFQQQQQLQNYPLQQPLQQQGSSPVQPQQGNRRNPGQQLQQQQQLFQQQQQQLPIQPQAQIPQQAQLGGGQLGGGGGGGGSNQHYPQAPQQQGIVGGLNRQQFQGNQNQQFGGGLQGQQFPSGVPGSPSQLNGGFQNTQQQQQPGQGLRRRRTTTPPQEEDDEDNDE